MFKYKIAVLFLLTAFLMMAKAYCLQAVSDGQVSTISGTVTYVDTAGDVVSVDTYRGTMVFDIGVESDLFRFAHHMSKVEIAKGDPVMIQYKSLPSGKYIIVKLVDSGAATF